LMLKYLYVLGDPFAVNEIRFSGSWETYVDWTTKADIAGHSLQSSILVTTSILQEMGIPITIDSSIRKWNYLNTPRKYSKRQDETVTPTTTYSQDSGDNFCKGRILLKMVAMKTAMQQKTIIVLSNCMVKVVACKDRGAGQIRDGKINIAKLLKKNIFNAIMRICVYILSVTVLVWCSKSILLYMYNMNT
jgi:hypothetical protein